MIDDDTTMPEAEADTGSAQTSEPSVEAAAAPEAAQAEQETHGDQPTNPVAPDTKADGSLTPPNSQSPEQQPQRDWSKEGPTLEKRLRDQQSYFDRQISQWKQQMSQTQEKASQLEKWKSEQDERAKAASLKPWSKAHPENQKFNGLLERAKVINSQLQRIPANLPPEQQEAMKQAIISAMSPEEQNQINEYRDNLQNFQRDFFTDPHGTLLPMVEQLAEQKVQQFMSKMEAQHSVQSDFADPQLAPLIKEHGQDFARALQEMPSRPYDYAKQMMLLYAENQRLKANSSKVDAKAEMAKEQQRLTKGEAAITRDPRPANTDSYTLAIAEAKRKGIDPSTPRFAQLLAKYES
jgi:hypothetical protein